MTANPYTDPAPVGADYIRDFARRLPASPGVYRMIGLDEVLLYVGKARNLKNRVSSYAGRGALSTRILRMVAQTVRMEVMTTRSEAEALLLEASLIKSLKPRYNILLTDDKSFPYIRITDNDEFPRILKHRGAQKKGESYFGPFASVNALNQTLALLQRAFLLRPCADNVFKNRTRPCLEYQIKRCSAPCVNYITREDYAKLLDEARQFLNGHSRAIQDRLVAEMEKYSVEENYEKAAQCRDRIRALTQVQQEQALHLEGMGNADVFACWSESGYTCVQVFFFRGGQHFGNQSFFPANSSGRKEGEILEALLGQFYQRHAPPAAIFLSHSLPQMDVMREALSLHSGHKVGLIVPGRGRKREVVEKALENAKAAMAQRLAERQTEARHLAAVAALFSLSAPPRRIEVYDNSHISGTHAVGAMIVAGEEGFEKNLYRRFTIRNAELTPGDDYAMLNEVMTRRLGRLTRDDPERTQGMWPDLLLIDGGKGQLSVVVDVMAALGICDLPVVAIAKGVDRDAGREWFFTPGREPVQLPPHTPVLHYLQRLRDEAHRFAITSHRIKRAAAIRASELDQIPGVGPGRKKALLHHFGSARGVEDAPLSELEKVPGVSHTLARQIHTHFHE